MLPLLITVPFDASFSVCRFSEEATETAAAAEGGEHEPDAAEADDDTDSSGGYSTDKEYVL